MAGKLMLLATAVLLGTLATLLSLARASALPGTILPGAYNVGLIGSYGSVTEFDETINTGREPSSKLVVVDTPTATPTGTSGGPSIANSFIEVDAAAEGRFVIGTTGGDPGSSIDNNKILLYGFPDNIGSSYTTLRFANGTSNDDFRLGYNVWDNYWGVPPVAGPVSDGSIISTTWLIQGVRATERLYFAQNADTGRPDIVGIEYTIKNENSTSRNIGGRLMLDTMIGDNDGAPYYVPGVGWVTNESEWSGAAVPASWTAYETLNDVTSLRARGRLSGGDATPPDRLVLANWGDTCGPTGLFDTDWDYTVTPGASLLCDSAVALYYNPRTIGPGETFVGRTYYGLGAPGAAPPTNTPTVTPTPMDPTATPTPVGPTATSTATPTPTAVPNDNWADAIRLTVPTMVSGSNVGATFQSFEQIPCGGMGSTIWYRIAPTNSARLFADTAGSSFNTVLALYRGTSLTTLINVACNDDWTSYQSRITYDVLVGTTYYLQVGGYFGSQGAVNLAVGWETPSTPTPTVPPTATPTVPSGTGCWQFDPGNPAPVPNNLFALGFPGGMYGWAVGSGGMTEQFAGGLWSPVTPVTSQDLSGLSMVSTTEGWAVGLAGTILHYTGGSWQVYSGSPTTVPLYGVAMVSASDGWAVGSGGTILRYDGSWQAWAGSPTTRTLRAIQMLSATDGWAVGSSGTILHYNGTSWVVVTSPTTVNLYGLNMSSASAGWAVGAYGTILQYAGGNWVADPSPTMEALQGVLETSSGTWAVGSSGVILRRQAGVWQAETSPTTNVLWAIGKNPFDEVRAVGFAGTILKRMITCPPAGTPTATPTATSVGGTATATRTATATPGAPTATATPTPMGPTATPTATRTPTAATATATATAPAASTLIGISPWSSTAVVNIPITVNVVITNVSNMGGFQFTLDYDNARVLVDGITMGPFPGSTGRAVSPLGPTIDNANGTATFGSFSLGSTPAGPSGNGVIARVRLLPQAAGTTPLHLPGVQASDILGANIPVSAVEGRLVIRQCIADLDGDGDVDILDVQAVAGRWNTQAGDPNYDPRYDLDGDGDIDILDVQTVAGRWNTTC